MKIERFAISTCCGGSAIAFKLGVPLSKDFLPLLMGSGYLEVKHFTKAGLLYVEHASLTATGAFGADILQIRCKGKQENCLKYVDILEELLKQMG